MNLMELAAPAFRMTLPSLMAQTTSNENAEAGNVTEQMVKYHNSTFTKFNCGGKNLDNFAKLETKNADQTLSIGENNQVKNASVKQEVVDNKSYEMVADDSGLFHSQASSDKEDEDDDDDDEDIFECGQCDREFNTLSLYMSHDCLKSTLKSSCNRDSLRENGDFSDEDDDGYIVDDESDSEDFERFEGKILYNLDGTVCITENPQEDISGDFEGMFKVQPGCIVDNFRMKICLTGAEYPQIHSAVFVPKVSNEFGVKCPSRYSAYNVLSLNNVKDNWHAENFYSNFEPLTSRTILMCLLCRFSFNYVKAFAVHTTTEHSIALNFKEREILSRKNASAIIQGVGKERQPLLLFLQPELLGSCKVNSDRNMNISGSNITKTSSNDITNVSYIYAKPTISTYGKIKSDDKIATNLLDSIPNGDHKEIPFLNRHLKRHSIAETPSASDKYSLSKIYPESSDKDYANQTIAHSVSLFLDNPAKSEKIDEQTSVPNVHYNIPRSSVSLLTSASGLSSNVPSSSPGNSTGMSRYFGLCQEHIMAKNSCSDCTKCNIILNKASPITNHVNMIHSRNSCKTLKCPKCNWHYKYQETLEIHMKEKHPDSETTCVYCLTGQSHPRLARGETYTCGYKPYRCEVCNYSTTTKGNLSIHMQSDKHLNNMQEVSSGSVNTQTVVSSISHTMPDLNKISPSVPTSVSSFADASLMKKAKPKPMWRCDVCNYETNVARNLRIHMTSEKHTHNMLVLQQNMNHIQRDIQLSMTPMGLLAQQQEAASSSMIAMPPPLIPASNMSGYPFDQSLSMFMGPQSSQGLALPLAYAKDHIDLSIRHSMEQPGDASKLFQCCICNQFSADSVEILHQHMQMDRTKMREQENITVSSGTYLCNLCTYKTNLKANFQLHCKTDKHLQRLQLINHIKEGGHENEWRLKYINVNNPVQLRCNCCAYFTNSIHKLQLHTTEHRHEANSQIFSHLQFLESRCGFERRFFYCSMCDYSARTKTNLIEHIGTVKHLHNETVSMQNADLMVSGALHVTKVFQVKELTEDTTLDDDDTDDVRADDENSTMAASPLIPSQHSSSTALPVTTTLNSIIISSSNSTNKANTDVPVTALDATSTKNEVSNDEVTDSVVCPFCSSLFTTEMKLNAHVLSQHGYVPRPVLCPLCQDKSKTKSSLESHLIQVHNVTQEGLNRLLIMVDQSEWMPQSENCTDVQDTAQQNCNNNNINGAVTGLKSEIALAEHDEINLEAIEEASKITLDDVVDTSSTQDRPFEDDMYRCQTCSKSFINIDQLYAHQNELGHLELKQTPRGPGYLCWKKGCNQYFKTAQSLQVHFREIHAKKPAQTIYGDVSEYQYTCSLCTLAFRAQDKLQIHMQIHALRAIVKCNVCSKTFRTVATLRAHIDIAHIDLTESELVKLHCDISANMAVVNGAIDLINLGQHKSSNGSLSAASSSSGDTDYTKETFDNSNMLKVDLEEKKLLIVSDNDEDNVENGRSNAESGYKEEQFLEDYVNRQSVAEGNYDDPARKYKCHRCKVAFTKQCYLSAHNKTNQHKKGDSKYASTSYTTEKYLDPNRPYKCDICMESFTQKNILLVHYNSVSHLHKVKQSSLAKDDDVEGQDLTIKAAASRNPDTNCNNNSSSNQSPESENKPYKCNICHVAYSQCSTLDIHIRSVLHQSRSSKLQDLLSSGEVNLKLPLIEQPESKSLPSQKIVQDILPTPTPLETTIKPSVPSQLILHGFPGTVSSIPNTNIPISASTSAGQNFSSASLLPTPILPKPIVQIEQSQKKEFMPDLCDNDKILTGLDPRVVYDLMGAGLIFPGALPQREPTVKAESDPINDDNILVSRIRANRVRMRMHKKLLKNFGFECVMHFNEYNQRLEDNDKESSDNDNESVDDKPNMEVDGDKTDEKESAITSKKADKDVPEINKSLCTTCNMQFSSIWVLKTHKEEIHQEFVSLEKVEEFGKSFKTEFELKQKAEMEETLKLANQVNNIDSHIKQEPNVSNSLVSVDMSQIGLPMFNMVPMSLNLPLSMSMNSPLIPMMMHPSIDVTNFTSPTMPTVDQNFVAQQQKHLQFQHQQHQQQQQQQHQQQQQQQQNLNNQKRARTRINDEQLKILRAHFDINNSPNEDEIITMSQRTGLPMKVIKHWFRNTLFKERQRNKDSPYNFNNPPSTSINLEEYEKTGKISVEDLENNESAKIAPKEALVSPAIQAIKTESPIIDENGNSQLSVSPASSSPISSSMSVISPVPLPHLGPLSVSVASDQTSHYADMLHTPQSLSPMTRRANRTRFTDFQINYLQDYFDQNAYPKDEELDQLSEKLNLSPRVIVVWFQNTRQKARKSYENQVPLESSDDKNLVSAVSSNLNPFICNKCASEFPTQYDLIRHQKSKCLGHDETLVPNDRNDHPPADKKENARSLDAVDPPTQESHNALRCGICNLKFENFMQWKDHQSVHMINPALFPPFTGGDSAFAMLQSVAQQHESRSPPKRKIEEEFEDDDQPRDKRLRTTILPEQLDYLYQKYQHDNSPSRKQLETISRDIGLKKRVVQVWFQNTRARERKGQYRAHQQIIHKRCPFCRALFRAKSALESHLATKHPDEMAKGEINIDALPDAPIDMNAISPSSSSSTSPSPNIDISKMIPPLGMQSYMPYLPTAGLPLGFPMDPLSLSMKQMYEDSLKKLAGDAPSLSHLATQKKPMETPHKSDVPDKIKAENSGNDAPLDLSKPMKPKSEADVSPAVSQSLSAINKYEQLDYSISDRYGLSLDGTACGKRYRTQMTNLQVHIMRLFFVEYKTPTMAECELLGQEIGLPKRVVQVWFQNARAKEKKAKGSMSPGSSRSEYEFPHQPDDCKLCNFKYSHKYTIQDHIFTTKHINNVRKYVQAQGDKDLDVSSQFHPQLGDPDKTKQSLEDADNSNNPHLAQLKMMGLNALGLNQLTHDAGKDISKSSKESTTSRKDEDYKPKLPSGMNEAMLSNLHMMSPFANFLPGIDPSILPYMYAGLPPYYGGIGMNMMQPPGFMPGAEQLFSSYDPMTFGTPLSMLQIPQQAIKAISSRLLDPSCSITQYTQDCKCMADLKTVVTVSDYKLAREATVDVGYICKNCQMVYPAREACMNHQRTVCLVASKVVDNVKTVLKLEQLQYECRACLEKVSTLQEYKVHCQQEAHKVKAAKYEQHKLLSSSSTMQKSASKTTESQNRPGIKTVTSGTSLTVSDSKVLAALANSIAKSAAKTSNQDVTLKSGMQV